LDLKQNKLIDDLRVQPEYFRICQYNIMADSYTEPYNYPYCEPSILYWPYRQYSWKKEIKLYSPHILCFQEVEEVVYKNILRPWLNDEGYEGILRVNREPEGVAIFWKKQRFNLILSELQQFNTLAMEMWKEQTSKSHLLYSSLLNKIGGLTHHNTLAVAVLEDTETNKKLLVATTHLYWGGGLTHDYFFQIQMMQAHLMTEYLFKIEQKYGGSVPLIIAGDFNSKSESGILSFFKESSIPANHPILTRDGKEDETADRDLVNKLEYLKLQDGHVLRKSGPLEVTNVTKDFTGAIDFILHSSNLLQVGAIVEPYQIEVYTQFEGLPNIFLSSDHISLFADVKFV